MLILEVHIEREADVWASYFISERIDFSYTGGPSHVFKVEDYQGVDSLDDAKDDVACCLDMSGPAALSVEVKSVPD